MGGVVIPRIFPNVPQSFLGILRVPLLPPRLEHPPLKNPTTNGSVPTNRWEVTTDELQQAADPEGKTTIPISLLGGGFKCFLFSSENMGKMNPFWLIFFRWVETTNQLKSSKSLGFVSSVIFVTDSIMLNSPWKSPFGRRCSILFPGIFSSTSKKTSQNGESWHLICFFRGGNHMLN